MHHHKKGVDGKYHINGHTYELLIGSRAQVWHGTAFKTKSGLTKHNLVQNKRGRIVSRKKQASAKKNNIFGKLGLIPKKGTFKLFRKSDIKHRYYSNKKKTMKRRK